MPQLESDAYSTGEVLSALHQSTGLPTTDPVYQRGLQFLLSTQHADGSWRVESRLHPPAPVSPDYFNGGFPHGRYHQFISMMGTEWATMALLHAVSPKQEANARKLAERRATPPGIVLFQLAISSGARQLGHINSGEMRMNMARSWPTIYRLAGTQDRLIQHLPARICALLGPFDLVLGRPFFVRFIHNVPGPVRRAFRRL